jgi:hypothetical protein
MNLLEEIILIDDAGTDSEVDLSFLANITKVRLLHNGKREGNFKMLKSNFIEN